ncbi:MAG: nucleotide pyrophosphohydrolase [Omnitrophica bacterium RIFCSPLOWO2_01_FULL_45_10]|nr:MAG: nucleotide pyrophosphohydrolase [Omnitrophica bacterium RIFCSPLOWO2_01_FULL_45_10]
MSDIKQLTEKIKKFRDERDWMQFHNHKDMAISLAIEAAELLEHFQWKTLEETNKHAEDFKDEISEELADIAMYLFELSDNLGIDLSKAIEDKLTKNNRKYPIQKAKGKHTKYNQL